jgi:hypothetical protein
MLRLEFEEPFSPVREVGVVCGVKRDGLGVHGDSFGITFSLMQRGIQ